MKRVVLGAMIISVICFGLLLSSKIGVDKPKQVTEVAIILHKPIKVKDFPKQEVNNVVVKKKAVKRDKRKSPSRGSRLEYIAQASAYTWTGNRTASGVYPKASHTIAVDTNYIPIGARVSVYTMNGDLVGIFKAEDTGRAIDVKETGRMIDVYFNSKGECFDWGVRKVRIVVE